MTKWERLWEHEDHRWSYMSDKELLTRLGRIRNPIKLECFIMMAQRYKRRKLENAGIVRQADLIAQGAYAEKTEVIVQVSRQQRSREGKALRWVVEQKQKQRVKIVSPPRKTDFLNKVADMERAIDF